jgi:O-antigen/teichoic acid export membrane protein
VPAVSGEPEAGAAAREARSYGRSATLLTAVFGVAGGLTYVYFAVASHNLAPGKYGHLAVLWSVAYVASVTLFRPTEQLLARSLAEHGRSGRVLRIAASIQLGVATASVALALALSTPLTDDLLGGDETAFAVLIAALAGFAASYYLRGYFAGTKRFGLYAAVLTTENVVRLGFAVAFAAGLTDNADVVLVGIAAAPLVSLLVAPLVILRPRLRRHAPPAPAADTDAGFTLGRGGGFAAAVLAIMLSEQLIMNGGVLFVRAADGAEAAGEIFNILMVARAPLVLFQAVATSLLPTLTRLWTRGDPDSLAAFRVAVGRTVLAVAAFAAAVTVVLLAIGPWLMQVAFGDAFTYDRTALAIVAVGMGFYLCAGTLTQAALAQGQARRAALCWGAAAVLFAAVNLSPALDDLRRVEVAFGLTAIALCALLYLVYRRPHPHAGDSIEPGSTHELEARLGALDEVV